MNRIFYFVTLAMAACLLNACSKSHNNESTNTDSIAKVSDSLTADTAKSSSIDYDAYLKLESYVVPDVFDTALFKNIDYNCAIIVNPTDKQIEEMIKENGEEDFATIADDVSYYQSMASQRIDSVGVKSVSTEKQFIKLVGSQKTWTLDVRKANMPEWNIIFFNKKKEPEIISAIDLTTTHVREYFDQK